MEEEKLNKHVDTLAQLASVRNTIDTRDKFYDEEMNFWNEATPQLQECQNAWSRAMLDSPFRADFTAEYGDLMFVNAEIADKAFSPDILDEMAQENKLTTEYGKLIASAQIPFEGGVYTLSQLSPSRTTPTMPAVWPPGRPRAHGTKSTGPSLTASTTSSSTCVTPWAKSSAMRLHHAGLLPHGPQLLHEGRCGKVPRRRRQVHRAAGRQHLPRAGRAAGQAVPDERSDNA